MQPDQSQTCEYFAQWHAVKRLFVFVHQKEFIYIVSNEKKKKLFLL